MSFQIKQEKFEGPLELLLELIEKERLAISDVSLAKIADEYVKYVKSLEKIDPESLAEFLVVAAQLMLIKSRALLPQLELTPEETASIEELERRLQEYQKIRAAAQEIKKAELQKNFIYTRESYLGMEPIFYPPRGVTANKIAAALTAFLETLPKIEKLAEDRIRRIISLEEKINQIRAFLQEKVERAFSEIIKGAGEKTEIIVSFLALLELARQKFLDLHQEKLFEDIIFRKKI